MNSPRDFVRTSFSTLAIRGGVTRVPVAPSAAAGLSLSRAGLPVVSNRAFIAGWTARRNQLAAAAQLVRGN